MMCEGVLEFMVVGFPLRCMFYSVVFLLVVARGCGQVWLGSPSI